MINTLQESATAYVNGNIITIDADDTIAQAMLIMGERIVAVGDTRDILELTPSWATQVDLEGRTVIPGLIDGHVHAELTATNQKLGVLVEIPKVKTVAQVLNLIAEAAAKTPHGQWIIARGPNAMASKLQEQRLPTIQELDKVAPNHPAAVFSAIHVCVMNHAAIQKTGWWHETRLPKSCSMGRDPATGEPTGVYTELWSHPDFMIPWDDESLYQSMKTGVEDYYVSGGITSIHELPYSVKGIRNWQRMRKEGSLPLRVRMFMTHPEPVDLDHILSLGLGRDFGDQWLSIGGIKIFVDGVMSHADGYYMPDIKWDHEELEHIVCKAHNAGYQLWLHTLSPPAIQEAVDVYETALTRYPRADHRHRIEHCADRWHRKMGEANFVPPQLKNKIKTLGIIPVSTPQHISAFPDREGVPIRTLMREGIITPGASDTTGAQPESCNPWYGIGCLVTRRNLYGKVLTPEECLTPMEALRMNTLWGAYCAFEENIKGSLEPGKLADFCILDQNPLTIDPEGIKDITVAVTIVGGEVKYASGTFAGLTAGN